MNNLRYERYKNDAKIKSKMKKEHNRKYFTQNKKRFLISFSITFLSLSLIVCLVVTFLNYDEPNKEANVGITQQIEAPETDLRVASKSFTTLVCVCSDKTSEPVQFLLYRLDAFNRQTVILSLPVNLEVIYNGNRTSLKSVFREGSISTASDVLSNNLSINIDYTVLIGSENFQQIFFKLGGIYIDVPKTFEFREDETSLPVRLTKGRSQYTCGDKIYALIAADNYISESEKLDIQTEVMRQFVTNKFTGLYISRPQYYFGPIFNLISTRFSMDDLLKLSYYIESYSDEESVKTPHLSISVDKDYLQLEKIDDQTVFEEYFK